MAMGLKQESLPMLDLSQSIQRLAVFENVSFKKKSLLAFEDVSKQFRRVSRTHPVNLAWCAEVGSADTCEIPYIESEHTCTDILTKAFVRADKFAEMRRLVGRHTQNLVP